MLAPLPPKPQPTPGDKLAPQREPVARGSASCEKGPVRRFRWWFGCATLLLSSPAFAEDHPLWLAGGLSLLELERPPYQASATGLQIGLRYTLNDQFWLLSEITSASYSLKQPAPSPCPEPPAPCEETTFPYPVHGLLMATGVVYTLDVTRLTPYGGLMVGASRLAAGEGTWGALQGKKAQEYRLGWALAAGADYHLNEQWAVGVGLRLHEQAKGTQIQQYMAQIFWRFR